MSWRLMEAALDLRLPDEQERILVRLARYASDDGSRCFPGVAQLAADSGRSERSVQRTLRTLERDGRIFPVANRLGGRGRTTEFQLALKGDTHSTLSYPETVTPVTPIIEERVTPVAERVTPVTVKGDTRVTPIDHEEITGTDQSSKTPLRHEATAATDKPAMGKVNFGSLSEPARRVVDDWRQKQGKTRPPTFNPVQAKYLEDAVSDLGVDRLTEANDWAAREGVPEFVKVIRAARTRRAKEEAGEPLHGAHRPPVPTRNGSTVHRKPLSADAEKLLESDPVWGRDA